MMGERNDILINLFKFFIYVNGIMNFVFGNELFDQITTGWSKLYYLITHISYTYTILSKQMSPFLSVCYFFTPFFELFWLLIYRLKLDWLLWMVAMDWCCYGLVAMDGLL